MCDRATNWAEEKSCHLMTNMIKMQVKKEVKKLMCFEHREMLDTC